MPVGLLATRENAELSAPEVVQQTLADMRAETL